MNKTPYQILGVSPTADDEEIKQAYRELARKYHPDRYSNSDLSELASEKMKEINAAYEEIREMRASGNDPYAAASRGASGGTSGNSSGSAYGGSSYQRDGYTTGNYREGQYSQDALRRFALIRNCLNQGNLTEAERLLNETPDADRGAEWYFLLGHIQLRKGFHVDAQNSFETAYRMEPTNNEYWTFKEKMRARAQSFGGGYQTGNDGGCSSCDMCSSLICADCCCECMGGDLIPCC